MVWLKEANTLNSDMHKLLGRFLLQVKMGQKCDLTDTEKSKITKYLSEVCSIQKFSKQFKCDQFKSGGGVMLWAAVINDELVGPFRVADRLKMNSQNYCQFLEDTFFKQWYNKNSAEFKKTIIFMQNNAPSH